ncbi:hypothetical protein MTR67_015986 [Solanum verrucosum]|uniref:Reverse transcriptase zinc-binding domain-containing protein n=1 Tax=Solanum verrucosum TaxID=315347 RepID=A0AAF0QL15_SOLVR|nr:hypothetical protein MTR67_015986 [Solanum verrucosum]
MEDLNSMMKIAIQRRWLKGFRVGSRTERVLEIYHLLYADDTIVSCEATSEQISFLRLMLVIFEAISGLKINWRKSNIFPTNEVTQIQVLANILRCGVGKLPTVYLGLPLGVLNTRDNIIKKTENKLAMWKGQYLSLGEDFEDQNDNWDGQGTLQEAFPSIFNINTNQNSTIENIWTAQGWNLIFRRFLNDWEVERVVSLLGRIGTFIGTTNEPDIFKWRHNIDGKFSVNRVYKKGLVEMTERDRGPWKATWRSMAPTKVKCFSWLVVRKACLTYEALQKRKFHLDSNAFFVWNPMKQTTTSSSNARSSGIISLARKLARLAYQGIKPCDASNMCSSGKDSLLSISQFVLPPSSNLDKWFAT